MVGFTMQLLRLYLVASVLLFSLVNGQVRVENLPLTVTTPAHCDSIIETHAFEGNCCALNVTAGGGCLLTIVNGRCIVRGQFWTLDYTSTYTVEGATCPPSEYNVIENDEETNVPVGTPAPQSPLQIGQTLECVEGFIMDFFCIDRGTLLDRPSAVTLENPDLHSVHCLIDVMSCLTSHFEVLIDPELPGDVYKRGFTLSDNAKALAVNLAQQNGVCDSCTSGGDTLVQQGFRAAFIDAIVIDLGGADRPPLINASKVFHSTFLDDPCTQLINGTFTDPPTASPAGTSGPPENDRCVFATRIEPNVKVTGTTAMANFDYLSQGVCGIMSDRRAVWYELIGSGKTVTIKLCSNGDRAVTFGVFAQCNSQDCVGFAPTVAPAESCANLIGTTSYTFSTEIGQSYFIHVREAGTGVTGASFDLIYAEAGGGNDITPAPTPRSEVEVFCGDEPCFVPVPISCDEFVDDFNFFGSCCSLEAIAAADECRVTVFQGSCLWTRKCGECSPLEIAAGCDTIYQTAASNECLASEWDPLSRPTTVPSPSCSPVAIPGVNMVVENSPLSTSSPASCERIIALSTFAGDCCALSATEGRGCVLNVVNGQCIVLGQFWNLDYTSTYSEGGAVCPPSQYTVFKPDENSSRPSQSPIASGPPDNDRCVNAMALKPSEQVTGDTTNANFDFFPRNLCGVLSDQRAVWYTLIGTGNELTVSVCTNNNRTTSFGIFEECNSPICVGAPGLSSGTAASCANGDNVTYSFDALDGLTYYIHVRSELDDDIGSSFNLVYEEAAGSPTLSIAPTLPPSLLPSNFPSSGPTISLPPTARRSNAPSSVPSAGPTDSLPPSDLSSSAPLRRNASEFLALSQHFILPTLTLTALLTAWAC